MQYRRFMPDGMVALFQGTDYWKMPADVAMEVGPTIIHPLPRTYIEATEKYAAQVKLVGLPDSGLTLEGYRGGIPFPSPGDPHRGWKILANEWYRYQPHLAVDTHGSGCLLDQRGSINCVAAELLDRQLAYNTDPGVPASTPGAEGKFYAQYLMVLEPEQRRYTASLTVSYTDRPDRKSLRVHSATEALSTGLRPRALQPEPGHRRPPRRIIGKASTLALPNLASSTSVRRKSFGWWVSSCRPVNFLTITICRWGGRSRRGANGSFATCTLSA